MTINAGTKDISSSLTPEIKINTDIIPPGKVILK